MNRKLLWAGISLASFALSQTKAPPPPPAETYQSSIEGVVIFPATGDRLPVASVKAIRIKPNYWTSPAVTSSLRGGFRLEGLPAGDYALCAGSANPKYADSCFWFDGRATLSLASGEKLSGQKVSILAGRTLEVRLRDQERLLAGKDAQGQSRSLALQIHGPPGSFPRTLLSTRPESDGQTYRVTVPASQTGTVKGSSVGLRIGDEAGRELPSAAFTKTFTAPAGFAPIQLEFKVLGVAVASPGKL